MIFKFNGIKAKAGRFFDANTETSTTYKPCKHKNGWYDNIKLLCFNIAVYFCTDCERAIYGKELKKIK